MSCPSVKLFKDILQGIDTVAEIKKDKENPLRYDVWGTTPRHVKNMINTLSTASLPNENSSIAIEDKLKRTFKRLVNNENKVPEFISGIIEDNGSIPMTIALYEMMESVKGESDKARNAEVDISSITIDGVLPSLPLSRIAASVGRKILFQQGFRATNTKENPATSEQVEHLYFLAGQDALQKLQDKGYVVIGDGNTIKDYVDEKDKNKVNRKTYEVVSDTKTVSLNVKTLNIKADSQEAMYFTQREASEILDTELGAIVDVLSAVRQITQPSKYKAPDQETTMSDEDYEAVDVRGTKLDETSDKVRKKLYEKSLKINNSVHSLLKLLHEEVKATGLPASKIIKDTFKDRPNLVRSLFGLKDSDLFSTDKSESVAGQNKSKTVAIDDIVEYYELLMDEGNPADLHFPLKTGRNMRLYYLNSILNSHASKQSRYMLTPGEQTIKTGSDDFKYLVYKVAESFNSGLVYADVVKGSDPALETALQILETYDSATTFKGKLEALSHLPKHFPGVDYVSLLTSLQAVKDIRNPKDGSIKTEYAVSADATASGGTLTFFQALATEPNIRKFLESLGMFTNDKGDIEVSVSDIYQLMTDAVSDFLSSKQEKGMASDLGVEQSDVKGILNDTLNLLFNRGKDAREFAKSPTMTFLYLQGKSGSIETITSELADRIIDSLDSQETRAYLAKLFKNADFLTASPQDLNATEGLYKDIKKELIKTKLPATLYELLGSSIKEKFLAKYQDRSTRIFDLVKKVMGNKVIKMLPAAAILDGKVASKDLAEYGMAIAKIFEIMHKMPDGSDVLTQKELLHKTIMDVSITHSIDAALLYHSLNDIDFKDGVVVVHDEVRGSVATVRALEAAYVKKAKEVLTKYDIHEQMLEALKVYHPEVVDNAEFKALEAEVKDTVKAKQEQVKDFNENTKALIGDGDTFKDFAKATKQTDTKPKITTKSFMEDLSKDSPLIRKFLNIFNTTIKESKDFSYNPSLDEISINIDSGNREASIEAVEHEIVHAATIAHIRNTLNGKGSPSSKRDLKYFQKTLESLQKFSNTSEELQARLGYINSQPTEEQRIGEFVAVMLAEKEIASEVYGLVNKRKFENTVSSFINKVIKFVKELTDADFEKEVDALKLYGALQRTLERGISDRIERQQEVQNTLKSIDVTYGFNKKVHPTDIDFLNKAVSRMIMDRAEETGKGILGTVHNNLLGSPLYSQVVDKLRGMYDSSEDLQQLLHTITGEGADKAKKAKVLAEYAKVTSQRNDFIQKNLSEFDKLIKGLSEESTTTLNDSITKVSLYDYFVQAKELNTVALIDDAVAGLEKELGVNSAAVMDVNNLVELNVNDKAQGDYYNLQNYSTNSEYHLKVRKLLALKSIQAVGTEKFVKLLENTELMIKVQDQVMANYLSVLGIGGRDNLRSTGVPHSFSEGVEKRAITLKELSIYEYSDNSGWVIAKKPTKTSLGLVYREVIDSTSIPGAFTDVKLSSSDIEVSRELKNFDNVIKTPTGFKMIVNQQQREAMGSLSAIQSLVRSTAHAMSIQESEIIRKELLKEETTFTASKDSMSTLLATVKDKSQDNPWFLKADGITYGDLDKEIRARYKPVGPRVSDVGEFSEGVTWVRKDISHWLLGGERNSPFTSPKWKWGIRIVKDLVAMAKIGMVVTNPGKIARDNLSNIAYLGVMGVSPVFAHNSYTEILEQFGEYTVVKDQLISLKVQLIARPESTTLKKKEKVLRNKLKQNPISSIEDKGFLNSLGSFLLARDVETLGGLQKDVDTALTFLLKDGKGKNNYVSHFILQMQKTGFKGEAFLGYLGGLVGKYGAGKQLNNELSKVEERLKNIRSDKDVVAYASQFVNAPQAEAVRFGANLTDLSDVLAKETYYRYLVSEGMKPEKAKIEVLDSFPNYIENMPLAVQQASDLGIIMFPSFWLRIQKAIYRMAKNRPVSLATEIVIDSYLDTNIIGILDANIYNKATSWSGILHSPFESAGLAGIFPTNAFNL